MIDNLSGFIKTVFVALYAIKIIKTYLDRCVQCTNVIVIDLAREGDLATAAYRDLVPLATFTSDLETIF